MGKGEIGGSEMKWKDVPKRQMFFATYDENSEKVLLMKSFEVGDPKMVIVWEPTSLFHGQDYVNEIFPAYYSPESIVHNYEPVTLEGLI